MDSRLADGGRGFSDVSVLGGASRPGMRLAAAGRRPAGFYGVPGPWARCERAL